MNVGISPLPDSAGSYTVMASSFAYPEAQFYPAYFALSEGKPYHVFLESGQKGRYSIAALEPFAVFTAKDGVLQVDTKQETLYRKGDPLDEMKRWLVPFQVETIPEAPDFQTGVVGSISYDYIRFIEEMPVKAVDDLQTPDLSFLAFQQVFIYDHEKKELWIVLHHKKGEESSASRKWQEWREVWEEVSLSRGNACGALFAVETGKEASFSREGFAESVEQVKEYIRRGDVFQVNLSVRQSEDLLTPPLHIYDKLRELNPSPYMGYYHTPDLQLVGGSPELLIKKRGTEASTRPIAGTRPRGHSHDTDRAYEKELMDTDKERAEHVMLVDLERNDLGKVCTPGSVEVDELMTVERYSHVMHIVSNVKGKLAEQVDVYDMIKAAFPGGTITGAPKIRTMEIIEEMEPVRRGMYTGSLGWIGFNNDMELNISIRTMVVTGGKTYVQAGAGIVIDSDPEAEYEEALRKAQALWQAKEQSEAEKHEKMRRAEEEQVYDFND
ncbi:anthranilate synthase component I family protein [Salibacterium lacus]|uniref:Anthranilate synthase component I family protein n=1 Tax=Salibacterium lacus TaxID=1898109 RepID=A0ABW5T493_9BACI